MPAREPPQEPTTDIQRGSHIDSLPKQPTLPANKQPPTIKPPEKLPEERNFFDEFDYPTLHKSMGGREIQAALEKLNGKAHYKSIAREFVKARRARREFIPKNPEAWVRNRLQRHCSLSKQYGGHSDWFRPCGKGIWRLVSKTDD